ncbi:MAG: phosphatidylserine decarboxylase family protein, partial [Bacteroidota bacterium]
LFFTTLVFSVQFFRNPIRSIDTYNNDWIYAPADGKVVVIEEAEEPEYFKDKRLQISIFMNPANVHVNRNPVSGKVKYYKYHPGKYLVAWHPKSSTENERTTSVINNGNHDILVRQIAGAMAKRIVNYLETGDSVKQGEDMGFIKFGSRVDIFLPLDAKVKVDLEQKVKGNKTVIAEL